MTDKTLQDIDKVANGIIEDHEMGIEIAYDTFTASLKDCVRELKRHREAVELYQMKLRGIFTESTTNERVLYEQALDRICGMSREAMERGDEILSGEKAVTEAKQP